MITLPIYYTIKHKRIPDKVILVGMNEYRNLYYGTSNDIKTHYHNLVKEQIGNQKYSKIFIQYRVYMKRKGTDGQNIRAVIEKFFLDGLVKCGAIKDDNFDYVVGDESYYFQDKENPRIEIEIHNITGVI